MQSAPTSGAHGTAGGDLAANAQSFARHLRAANKSPNTVRSYLEAALDRYSHSRGKHAEAGQPWLWLGRRDA